MDISKLQTVGVVIYLDTYSRTDQTRISSVFIPLTPSEWCDIAMREGESYIGGCCGQCGYIQDQINRIFRDSGIASAGDLSNLGEMCQHHPDGFQEWGFIDPMSQDEFDTKLSRWNALEPWEKIGLIYQAVKDDLKPHFDKEPIVQENRPDLDEKRDMDALFRGLSYIHYSSVFCDPLAHANSALATARLLPGCRRLLKKLEANHSEWTGFAIVEKVRPEVVCHNGYGLCLYSTQDEAEKVRKMWREGESGQTYLNTLIRPVLISVQDGLVFAKP